MADKICLHCKKSKSLDEYYFKNGKPNGACKQCRLLAAQNYSQENRDKISMYQKRYRLLNKDKLKEYGKQYFQENKERLVKRTKEYVKTKGREKYILNRRLYFRKRRLSPRNRINLNISRAIHLALHEKKNGRKWESLVGYTLDKLFKRLEFTMPDGCSWDDYLNGKLHIDHIIPISAFQYNGPEDKAFKKCWNLENLRLLPAHENIIKANKIIKETLDL